MLDFIKVGDIKEERDKFLAKVNKTAGKGNWFWTFAVGKKFYSWELGLQIYEDSFFLHFRNNIELLKELCQYNNVFLTNRFDIESGLDYKKQTQKQDHYNDIAIRRCLVRYGMSFKGKNLLSLENSSFSEKVIPFHLSHLLENKMDIRSWFYSNRFIVIATEIEDKVKFSDFLIR